MVSNIWMVSKMALTNEDLLAISQLLDVKLDARLKPIENRLKRIEVDLTEAAFADIEIMKKVIAEHSEKLQKLA